MNLIHLVSITFCFSSSIAAPSHHRGNENCEPQKTPLYGTKWCLFERHQAEIGSICWFSCVKGYHLRGPTVTKCVFDYETQKSYYNATIGFCEADAPILREGKNGPYLLHSYDPSNYVIHVGFGEQVTLKSYYYLALYVKSPGVNGVKNTVSILVQGDRNKYIKSNGTHVYTGDMLENTPLEQDRATFWLRENHFFRGYAAFESFTKQGYFLKHQSRKIVLSKVDDKEDTVCASFIWTRDL
uniref:otogelin-like protein n=1 Tax=Styela clava TaxID=7725 RepID=UPI0019393BBA|nr:otogelin-like protein [Styela clava]